MKAVIACAHKLLRIIYKILATHQEYDKEKVLGLRQQFQHQKLKKSQLQYNTRRVFLRYF